MYWCNVSCNHFTNQSMFAFQNSQSAWLSHYNYNRITDYRMRRSTSRGDRGVGSRGLWCGRENETYTIRHHYGCQGKLFVCMIRGFHQEFGGLGDLTRELLFWKKTFWLMHAFQLKMRSGSADRQTNQGGRCDLTRRLWREPWHLCCPRARMSYNSLCCPCLWID